MSLEQNENSPEDIVLDEVVLDAILAPDESGLLTPIPGNGVADDETLFIAVAADELDITRCYPVMQELRPHLDEDTFIRQVQRQQKDGYLLVYGEVGGEVVACAGFRVLENLAWGRFLYVDDLVTCSTCRSQGHGEALMNWLLDYARASNCSQFQLDSGVQRFEAHRFYFRQRMTISSYHFAMEL